MPPRAPKGREMKQLWSMGTAGAPDSLARWYNRLRRASRTKRSFRSFAMSTISSVPTTELASGPIDLTVVEPDGHYEVVNGKVVEKPVMGVFQNLVRVGTVWLASTIAWNPGTWSRSSAKCSSCSMRPTTSEHGRTSRLSLMSNRAEPSCSQNGRLGGHPRSGHRDHQPDKPRLPSHCQGR